MKRMIQARLEPSEREFAYALMVKYETDSETRFARVDLPINVDISHVAGRLRELADVLESDE